jgi:hypothetical protein
MDSGMTDNDEHIMGHDGIKTAQGLKSKRKACLDALPLGD